MEVGYDAVAVDGVFKGSHLPTTRGAYIGGEERGRGQVNGRVLNWNSNSLSK